MTQRLRCCSVLPLPRCLATMCACLPRRAEYVRGLAPAPQLLHDWGSRRAGRDGIPVEPVT
ncbi:hypothetical protein [Actinophytocola sp. KF-1]